MSYSPSRWTPAFQILRAINDEIAAVYTAAGVGGFRPHYAPAVLVLADGPRTIRELATATGVTHSAMSQTVAGLRSAGFAESAPGADARTQVVRLTDSGTAVARLVHVEWQATERALAELDAAVPHPLPAVVSDYERALADEPFADRLARQLARSRSGAPPETSLPDAAGPTGPTGPTGPAGPAGAAGPPDDQSPRG